MKHLLFGALVVLGATGASSLPVRAAEDAAVSVESFVGCWMTDKPEPIVILGADGKADDYQIFHENMLLFIEPIEDTQLVKGRYYAFSPDLKSVIGPAYVDGAFNPARASSPSASRRAVSTASTSAPTRRSFTSAPRPPPPPLCRGAELDRMASRDAAGSKEEELLAAQKTDAG